MRHRGGISYCRALGAWKPNCKTIRAMFTLNAPITFQFAQCAEASEPNDEYHVAGNKQRTTTTKQCKVNKRMADKWRVGTGGERHVSDSRENSDWSLTLLQEQIVNRRALGHVRRGRFERARVAQRGGLALEPPPRRWSHDFGFTGHRSFSAEVVCRPCLNL